MKPQNVIKYFRKIISLVLVFAFFSSSLYIPQARAGEMVVLHLPVPGMMVHLSPEYTPAHLQGLTIHPEDALKFDFLIHKGDGQLDNDQKKEEYTKLVKYFLASLTIPDEDQWVNLSPYEHNRIIKDDFGKTEMGRDLLSQDYLLKQMTSSLMYPEEGLGKKFWDRVYERAYKEYGTSNVPVNTFNKVWIIPDEAAVYERGNTVYILRNHLKVMLEEDYLSLQKHNAIRVTSSSNTHSIASQIIKEIILPELEKEVNEGKNFAMLRQIYSGMILATWYKHALKETLLGKVYANKAKVIGVNQKDPRVNEAIYQRYLKAFKKGVFNFIKEDEDKYSQQMIPRKYFAGGLTGLQGFVQGNHAMNVFPSRKLVDYTSLDDISEAMLGKIDRAEIVSSDTDSATVSMGTPKDAAMSGRRSFLQGAGSLGAVALAEQLMEGTLLGQIVQPKNIDRKTSLFPIKNGDKNEQILIHFLSGEAGLDKWLVERVDKMAESTGVSYLDILLNAHQFGIKTGVTSDLFRGLFKIVKGSKDPVKVSKALDLLFKISDVNDKVLQELRALGPQDLLFYDRMLQEPRGSLFFKEMAQYIDHLEKIGNITATRLKLKINLRSEKEGINEKKEAGIKFERNLTVEDFEPKFIKPILGDDKEFMSSWTKFKEGTPLSDSELTFLLFLSGIPGPFPEVIGEKIRRARFSERVDKIDVDSDLRAKILIGLMNLGDEGAIDQLKILDYRGGGFEVGDLRRYLLSGTINRMNDAHLFEKALDNKTHLKKGIENKLRQMFPTFYKMILEIDEKAYAKGKGIEIDDFNIISDMVLRRMVKIGLVQKISDRDILLKKSKETIEQSLKKEFPEFFDDLLNMLEIAKTDWKQVLILADLGNLKAQKTAKSGLVDAVHGDIDTLLVLWRKWGNKEAKKVLDNIPDKARDDFNKSKDKSKDDAKELTKTLGAYKGLYEFFVKTNSDKAYGYLHDLKLPVWFAGKSSALPFAVAEMVNTLGRLGNENAKELLRQREYTLVRYAQDVQEYLDLYRNDQNASALRALQQLTIEQVQSIHEGDVIVRLLDLQVPAAIEFVSKLSDLGLDFIFSDSRPTFRFRQSRIAGTQNKLSAPISMYLRSKGSAIKKGDILETFAFFSAHTPSGYKSPLQATISFFNDPSKFKNEISFTGELSEKEYASMSEDQLITTIYEMARANTTYMGTKFTARYLKTEELLLKKYKGSSLAGQERIRNTLIEILEKEQRTSIATGVIFGILRKMTAEDPKILLDLYRKNLPDKEFQFIKKVFESPLLRKGLSETEAETALKGLMDQARELFERYKKEGFGDGSDIRQRMRTVHYSSTIYFLVHRYVAFFIQQEDRRKLKDTLLPGLKLLNANEVRSRLLDIFTGSEIVDIDSEVGNADSSGRLNPGYLAHIKDLLVFYSIHWHEFGHNNVDAQAPWLSKLMSKYGEKDERYNDLSGIHETGGDIEAALVGFMESGGKNEYLELLRALKSGVGIGALNEVTQQIKKNEEAMGFKEPELKPEQVYEEYIKNAKAREGHSMARGFLPWLMSEKSIHGGILRDLTDWVLLLSSYNEVLEEIGKSGEEPAWEEYFFERFREKVVEKYKNKRILRQDIPTGSPAAEIVVQEGMSFEIAMMDLESSRPVNVAMVHNVAKSDSAMIGAIRDFLRRLGSVAAGKKGPIRYFDNTSRTTTEPMNPVQAYLKAFEEDRKNWDDEYLRSAVVELNLKLRGHGTGSSMLESARRILTMGRIEHKKDIIQYTPLRNLGRSYGPYDKGTGLFILDPDLTDEQVWGGTDGLVESLTSVKYIVFSQKNADIMRRDFVEYRSKIFSYRELAEKLKKDSASLAVKGGIDLNSANLHLQIKRDGRGVPLPLLQQDWAQLSQIQGFIPTILEIRPVTDLPILSELQQKLRQSPASQI